MPASFDPCPHCGYADAVYEYEPCWVLYEWTPSSDGAEPGTAEVKNTIYGLDSSWECPECHKERPGVTETPKPETTRKESP